MKPILLSQASPATFQSSAARKRAAFFEDLCEPDLRQQKAVTAESSNSVNLEKKVEKPLESLQQLSNQKNGTLPKYEDKSPLLLLNQVEVEPSKSKFFNLRKNGGTLIFEKVQKNSKEEVEKRHSLQWDVLAARKDLKKYRHSWYAYSHPEESEDESDNLAGVKRKQQNGQTSIEALALLEQSQVVTIARRKTQDGVPFEDISGANSLGAAAVPRRKRIEKFLKSLVGKRAVKEPVILATVNPSPVQPENDDPKSCPFGGDELRIPNSTSSSTFDRHEAKKLLNSSSTSLHSSTSLVQQTLWSVLPHLNRRDRSSCGNLLNTKPNPIGLRKCETVLALTHTASSNFKTKIRAKSINNLLEPIKPLNRLRNSASCFNALAAQQTCSRCSSLLSLAAGSKYSLNVTAGGFVSIHAQDINRPINNGSTGYLISEDFNAIEPYERTPPPGKECNDLKEATDERFTCKLCLGDHLGTQGTQISSCGCSFCTECMRAYVEFEITEGAYEVSCPDAMCPSQGVVSISEIALLASSSLVNKHHRYRLNREVELDKFRTWCPKAGCETICLVGPLLDSADISTSQPVSPSTSTSLQLPRAVHCPTCEENFCSGCKKEWHPIMSCEENARRLAANGQNDMMIFDNDLIKCCPMCAVPIEKDEGCAQMMCKRCKHVFCWYCLASLDDDFLLRHYDKGPCKNKLGHSRASVVWHRAQVIGIFAGFGILLLVASPLLLLAAPCIVCCKCRICSGAAKMEEAEADYDDAIGLQH